MKRPKFQPVFVLIALSLLGGCAAKRGAHANTVVLPYHELGPQAAAHELIGYEWYQWNSHGDSDPNKDDDVKVVVYRGISLEEVKEMYPVVEGKRDYRYLGYEAAINYLDKNEGEPYLGHLRETKKYNKFRQSINVASIRGANAQTVIARTDQAEKPDVRHYPRPYVCSMRGTLR